MIFLKERVFPTIFYVHNCSLTNLFGPSTQQQAAVVGRQPPASTNVFGAPTAAASSAGLFGQAVETQRDDSIYTPEAELTADELAAFKADHFELGKIPERPPPQSLCVV